MWTMPTRCRLNFDPWRHDILFYKNKSFEPRLWNLPKVWHLNFDPWRHDIFLRTFYLNNQWIAVVMNGNEQGFPKAKKKDMEISEGDEKQQTVKVTILICCLHTKTQKSNGYGNIGKKMKNNRWWKWQFWSIVYIPRRKKQRIWKYRQEDEKQQMVKVTILIYCVHAIISFSINIYTKT